MISDDRLSNSDDQIQMTDFLIKFRLHPKIKKEKSMIFSYFQNWFSLRDFFQNHRFSRHFILWYNLYATYN